MTKMAAWKNGLESEIEGDHWESQSYDIFQYPRQTSCKLGRLILGVEGVLVIHGQLMEDLVLKANMLMESLMYFTVLSILVTAFGQVEVVSLPLLRDAALHGENLENSYPCLLVKQFL